MKNTIIGKSAKCLNLPTETTWRSVEILQKGGLMARTSMHPLIKWLVVKCFSGNIEIMSFGVYFKFMMMFMMGRVLEWSKSRTNNEK
jgi:hypothetical protein